MAWQQDAPNTQCIRGQDLFRLAFTNLGCTENQVISVNSSGAMVCKSAGGAENGGFIGRFYTASGYHAFQSGNVSRGWGTCDYGNFLKNVTTGQYSICDYFYSSNQQQNACEKERGCKITYHQGDGYWTCPPDLWHCGADQTCPPDTPNGDFIWGTVWPYPWPTNNTENVYFRCQGIDMNTGNAATFYLKGGINYMSGCFAPNPQTGKCSCPTGTSPVFVSTSPVGGMAQGSCGSWMEGDHVENYTCQ
ncbi:MAG: hypothetical protein PHX43_07855 [Alphaproteobacteria bacterium]|nr:hypothetical protein [Alphaproteobacteria bacterium]